MADQKSWSEKLVTRVHETVLLHTYLTRPELVDEKDKDWPRGLTLKRLVTIYGYIYEHDRNPVWAWRAYRLARMLGEPIPNWVLDYLDQTANGICNLSIPRKKEDPPKRKATPNDVVRALGLKKGERGHLMTTPAADISWIVMALGVAIEIDRGSDETYAIDEVAKAYGDDLNPQGVPKHFSTVRRAWKKYSAIFPTDDAVSQSARSSETGTGCD